MPLRPSKKAPSDCKAQCPDCGVILSRLADMNRHRKTKHPDGTETKFPCPYFGCGYEATQKGNLKSHLDARHSGGSMYPCTECHRRFTDAAARIRHRKKMHGYVPHHTKEYLARQALIRKGMVVQGASKAISNKNRSVREITKDNTGDLLTTALQQAAHAAPGDIPDSSSSVPPLAPKIPEVAYHDDFWKMPVDITHSYTPQPLPSQVPLSLPFNTWPGYDAPVDIRNFPSAAQSPPSLTSSDSAIDYHSYLYDPQPHIMPPQEEVFGESPTGDHGMSPYNATGLWDWPPQSIL